MSLFHLLELSNYYFSRFARKIKSRVHLGDRKLHVIPVDEMLFTFELSNPKFIVLNLFKLF